MTSMFEVATGPGDVRAQVLRWHDAGVTLAECGRTLGVSGSRAGQLLRHAQVEKHRADLLAAQRFMVSGDPYNLFALKCLAVL